MIDTSKWKIKPFQHQIIGVQKLTEHKAFALFDQMGVGKSAQVVNAACILAERGEIDTVVIVAPASVRCVWLDAEIGEIRKHAWIDSRVTEFHKKVKRSWADREPGTAHKLEWLVTNYEFLRGEDHLVDLCEILLKRTALLVLDESSYIKNRTSQQTKSVGKLRKHFARCVLLNGTPVTNSPLDLWSQMQVLDKKILGATFKDNFYLFRSEYCTMQTKYMGPRHFQQVTGYKNIDKLAAKVAPYVLRREKKDCLDLPPKLYTEREVALTTESWKRYQELKRDALLTLGNGDKHIEPNAAVRLMRLAQLTSGILGGNRTIVKSFLPTNESDDWDGIIEETQDLSDEKLKWAVQYLTEECTAKAVIVWCRFRRERERLVQELRESKSSIIVQELYGGQPVTARTLAVQTFSRTDLDAERKVLIAQPHAGGHGLNLVAASEAIYLSNDFSLGIRLQSEDRCHRPGQVNPVLYTDVLAVGPQGQHTIDRTIFRALREKKNLADFTTAEWRKSLEEE